MPRRFTDRTAFSGESLSGTFTVPDDTTAVAVKIADGVNSLEIAATDNDDGTWTANASAEELAKFSGEVRWVVFATTPVGTEAIENGKIYLRAIVSKYRAVVTAIESALQSYGSDPNKSISVGEISITYKDYEDLLGLLSYYRRRAAEDENGRTPTGGVKLIKTRFV